MKTFSPSEAAFDGFRLVSRQPTAILIWTVVLVLFSLGGLFLAHTLMGPTAQAAIEAGRANHADPTAALAMVSAMAPLLAVTIPLGFLFHAIFTAAAYRAVLRPEDKGFGYLKIGADEFRQLGLMLIYMLMGIGLYIALVIGVGIVAVIVGLVAGHAPGGKLIGIFITIFAGLAAIGTLIWIAVRLSLAAPMTFAEGRINLFGSWALTRGQFWPLFGCYFLTFIFLMIIALVAGALGSAASLPFGGNFIDFRKMVTPDAQTVMTALTIPIFIRVIVTSLFSGVQRAVATVPMAAVYRALTGTASDIPLTAPDGSVTSNL